MPGKGGDLLGNEVRRKVERAATLIGEVHEAYGIAAAIAREERCRCAGPRLPTMKRVGAVRVANWLRSRESLETSRISRGQVCASARHSGHIGLCLSAATTSLGIPSLRVKAQVECVVSLALTDEGPVIVGNTEGRDLLELPEATQIRDCTDQRRQVRLLAHFSRTILERTLPAHRILASAAASDPAAGSVQARTESVATGRRRRSSIS